MRVLEYRTLLSIGQSGITSLAWNHHEIVRCGNCLGVREKARPFSSLQASCRSTSITRRDVAFTFIIEMLVAMVSTKIGVFLGNSPLPPPPSPPLDGFWAVLHEIRSEHAQLLTAVFLLVAGSGPWSVHAFLLGKKLRETSRRGMDKCDTAVEQPAALAVHSDDSWSA